MRISKLVWATAVCASAQMIRVESFLIAPSEVTQREYVAVTGNNPAHLRGDDLPVENVSWWNAIRYCNLRSAKEGLQPCYDLATGHCDRTRNGYRLPTEAEWRAAPIKPPGRVWQWCQDWFDPAALEGAPGPLHGLERVIRGGSFATSASKWTKGYRSSLDPTTKSRYTGFRVVRSAPFSYAPYNAQPKGFETATGNLASIPPLAGLRDRWRAFLGAPAITPPTPRFRLASTFQESTYTGSLGYLNVEPDFAEKILILEPPHSPQQRLPVVIVPYYDVDTPAGRNLGGRQYQPPGVRSFAQIAARQGYLAVAIRWFGESYGESYHEAVANLAMKHPQCTGLGKWVWDAARLLDYLYTRSDVDRGRIAIIGHSLGGKMALYAAAMDERIRVAVASEPGIGFSHSNYGDPWYLGEKLAAAPAGMDQHELLALMAPRPFLLIGGDDADKDSSWHYINAARSVYRQFGDPLRVGFLNHHQGHSPTPEAVTRAIEWIAHFFNP